MKMKLPGNHEQRVGMASILTAIFAAGLMALASSLTGEPQPAPPPVEVPVEIVKTVPAYEFPAGGRQLAGEYRLVALYGSVEGPALGVLGEQDIKASIKRAKQLAKQYQPHSKEPILPTLEIIVTVAHSEITEDGDYSRETEPRRLLPWIKAAKEAGVYVVLDLQPGYDSFLAQAKQYRELLKEPHVGLALDPEWRLKPGERHLEQIGSVSAREVNQTSAWLADWVDRHQLPQKLLLLHQFRPDMLEDRHKIVLREQLHTVVQMDGQGATNVKYDSWNVTIAGKPTGMKYGWKNFIDEDSPMLSPKETMQIKPKPWYVSYQ